MADQNCISSAFIIGALACVATPVLATDPEIAGDWIIRARGLGVLPDESSSITVIGGKANAENTIVPELDFTYFVTDHVALELIAAITKHKVDARGTTLGTVPLGSAWLLPPTLTVQYHWTTEGRVSPYIGAGINYTHIYDANPPRAGAVTAINYNDSVGPALQVGVDLWVSDRWTFNIDAKKIWLNTNVSINNGAIKGDVNLNPWLLGVGFGYKF